MIITHVSAVNFGSYKELEIDVDNKGLSLIHGPTGSGKSTLPDVIAWTLFGVTAKNGNADDVRSWGTNEHTVTHVHVIMPDGTSVNVRRSRGGPGHNDLCWSEGLGLKRGKDLTDTQRLLDERLGVDANLFLTSSYFSDFSPTAGFFLASAKVRREVFEMVTDLSLPVKLAQNIPAAKKDQKAKLKTVESHLSRIEGAVTQLQSSLDRSLDQAEAWMKELNNTIAEESLKSENFEKTKASKLAALSTKSDAWESTRSDDLLDTSAYLERLQQKLTVATGKHVACDACGTVKGAEEVAKLKGQIDLVKVKIESVATATNPFTDQIQQAKNSVNTHGVLIQDLQTRVNPHIRYVEEASGRLQVEKDKQTKVYTDLQDIKSTLSSLDQLYDLSFALRGTLLTNAVNSIEQQTNSHLETFFDSEFRVAFSIEDGDSLKVEIFKGDQPCVYRQLSKGQRQLLKLCFSISVMEAAANTAGVHFDNLFLDESLDGCDDLLKAKAFRMFEHMALSHASIFVIDHCEAFQELFSSRYKTTVNAGESEIEEQ